MTDPFLGARASRPHDDGFPGARASRPHQARHSLGHLLHLDLKRERRHGSHNDGFLAERGRPASTRVAACGIALKRQRQHQAWHSLGHLPHLDQPATAPWRSFGLAKAVPAGRVAACSIALKLSGAANGTACGRDARAPGQGCSRRKGGCLQHRTEAQRQPKGQHAGGTPALPGEAVPADRVAACGIALKLSGSQRDSMRAGRPRSRARQKPGISFTPFINALIIPFVVLRG